VVILAFNEKSRKFAGFFLYASVLETEQPKGSGRVVLAPGHPKLTDVDVVKYIDVVFCREFFGFWV